MHVEVRKAGDVVIVDLQGKLLFGIGDEILRNVINELVAENWKKILLNLSGVSSVDSAGVGELVASQKLCAKFGARMNLRNLNERLKASLTFTQSLPFFGVYADQNLALQHFPKG